MATAVKQSIYWDSCVWIRLINFPRVVGRADDRAAREIAVLVGRR